MPTPTQSVSWGQRAKAAINQSIVLLFTVSTVRLLFVKEIILLYLDRNCIGIGIGVGMNDGGLDIYSIYIFSSIICTMIPFPDLRNSRLVSRAVLCGISSSPGLRATCADYAYDSIQVGWV